MTGAADALPARREQPRRALAPQMVEQLHERPQADTSPLVEAVDEHPPQVMALLVTVCLAGHPERDGLAVGEHAARATTSKVMPIASRTNAVAPVIGCDRAASPR